jgi:hypothetical protein
MKERTKLTLLHTFPWSLQNLQPVSMSTPHLMATANHQRVFELANAHTISDTQQTSAMNIENGKAGQAASNQLEATFSD